MGVYIKGMEMPKVAGRMEAVITILKDGTTQIAISPADDQIGYWKEYPLVPIPPHGRLIDADALMKEFEKAQRTMEQHGQEYSCSFLSSSQEISSEWYCVEDMVENAPTIIESEEGE